MCEGGHVTLYASCFAVMTLHYLGLLEKINGEERRKWTEYIQQWQDPETGRFVGPEIRRDELLSPQHDWDHVTMHLTAHVLPTLDLLGARPLHRLRFADRFLDLNYLRTWLKRRNWRHAWLEGNNLLFVGQFLTFLKEIEEVDEAEHALAEYFRWLDVGQDPITGLWGTNGQCDTYEATYGAYHQLLVYYYWDHPIHHARRIIDTVLATQHADGSFTRHGGGGACEDVDGVNILVNLFKRTGYRPLAVHSALHHLLKHVLRNQMPDGGFVYRRGRPFSQMGILKTRVPPDTSDMFSTWFRLHTIAIACQVQDNHALARIKWNFNRLLSMGWHETTPRNSNLQSCLTDFFYVGGRTMTRYAYILGMWRLSAFLRRGVGLLRRMIHKHVQPRVPREHDIMQ